MLFQAVPSAVYVTLRIIGSLDKTPRTVFIENVTRKKAKRSAIIVQEEIQSKTVSYRESPRKGGTSPPPPPPWIILNILCIFKSSNATDGRRYTVGSLSVPVVVIS